MFNKKLLPLTIFLLFCAGCEFQVQQIKPETPTALIITSTLPPTLTPAPSQTPLPPPPSPTTAPVEGLASTQINVRAEPATVSAVLGILPANTKVQIVGKDPGENWWQILYPQGKDGKGWVTAQYVTTAGKSEVPVIGGGALNPNNGNTAIIQQKLNIRSGPGTDFNSIGTLNPQDVISLTGKDANGAWLQIDFSAGPEGKGWVNAAFVQALDVDKLPIVTDAGQVVGTGTPVDTPPPPTPTVVPAPIDNDSAQAPAINVVFSATGTHSIQYMSDVSAPNGDTDDWLQFTPFTQTVRIDMICTGNVLVSIEVLQNNQPVQQLICGTNQVVATNAGVTYVLHIQATGGNDLNYTHYTIRIDSVQ
ncbi:MAG: SH3 domain-containing protein [Chloroflexota bacterium]